MAQAPDYLTWEGDSANSINPRRPSTDDLGGDEKVDDAEFPPNDKEHPTAAGWNQLVRQVAAMAKNVGACKLECRFSGGVPSLARVSSPNANVNAGSFTVVDNGVGDTSIVWQAGTFPSHQCAPSGLTVLLSGATVNANATLEELGNGIRVRTFDATNAAIDLAWTVEIN